MGKLDLTVSNIKSCDKSFEQKAWAKLDSLTKPKRSLGLLEEIACRLCVIKGSLEPEINKKVIFTLAADHGVCAQNVSLYPKEVTAQMVNNFLNGGAGVNALSKHINADVVVVDMGVAGSIAAGESQADFIDKKINHGTRDFSVGPAMSAEEALAAVEAGISVFEDVYGRKTPDIIGIGEMGIGNTTASSAIISCITGNDPALVTGRGTGIGDEQLKKKIEVIKKSIAVNNPDKSDGLDVVSKIGGYEIAGLAGVILAASAKKVPVVIDGVITAAAAMIAVLIAPECGDYLFASHNSVECGHKYGLNYLGLKPMFDFNMRLGEGTGACLGIGIIEASSRILNGMATFEQAEVSGAGI